MSASQLKREFLKCLGASSSAVSSNSFIIGMTVWQFSGMSLQGSFSSMLFGSAGYFKVFHRGEDLYLAG